MRHRRGQLIPQLPTVRFSHFSHCGFWAVGARDTVSEGSGSPSSLETPLFLQPRQSGSAGKPHPAGEGRTLVGFSELNQAGEERLYMRELLHTHP